MWIHELCGCRKVVVGMVHLDALPGTPGYCMERGLEGVIAHAGEDYNNLVDGGISAVIFCNENDKPYSKSVGPNIVASMTTIVNRVVGSAPAVPFGIDVQWDSMAALAVAKATGASFVRGIMCGTFCGDLGIFTPDAEKILKFRSQIDAEDIRLITNLAPEFSYRLDGRPVDLIAKTVVKSCMVDGLCVSGVMAGTSAEFSELAAVKNAVHDVPVFANTGVTPENVCELLKTADACVVATCLKVDCQSGNRIDRKNVEQFMNIAKS